MSENTLERLTELLKERYAVERELGRGGMATVFLATDVKHDRKVAIKVLHPDLSATIGGDRFSREIKLAGKLQHPHILGMYDSGEADGLLYYVMPFVEGEALRDRIDREGQLPIDDAIQITLEVADALGHAHKHDIVHRDIKPENVLLSGGHALVADFGIARAVTEGTAQKLTQTGMAVGTPVYMAPEQSVGEKIGPTADIYSLGCMLYEMLAGEPPFTGKNAMALMARHAMEAVPSIRIVRNTVPEEVEDTIFAAMAKAPADRLQSAEDFAEMLGMPLGATATRRASIRATASRRVPTMAHRTVGLEQPSWKKPWAIAAATVLLLGGAFATWQFGILGSGTPAIAVGGLDPSQIAVLYFEDQSSEQDLTFLTDGVTEALIQRLATVQGLSVISKGGVNAWRGTEVGDDSVARALSAGTIVRGAIDRDGGDLRVSLRLVDGNSGVDLGQRASITQPEADLIQIRDSVVMTVATLIRNRVGQEVRLRDLQTGTTSVEAWSLVQRAEQLRKSGEAAAATGDSVSTLQYASDMTAADSLLAVAEALDPDWAEPVVLRGLVAYRRSRLSGRDQVEIQRWVDVGLGHVDRALVIDPTNADAFEHRGNLRYWRWLMGLEPDPAKAATLLEEARTDLEQATNLNSAQAGAWASLSHLYNQTGTGVDVNLAAQRAFEADAFLSNADVILNRLFLSSYDLEDLPKAGRWCDEVRRRYPDTYHAPRCELFMLTTRGRDPDPGRAWLLADSVTQMAPERRRRYFELNSDMLVAAVLARAGLSDSAAALAEASKGDAEVSPTRDLNLFGAFVYRLIGDTDKAVDMLKIYFAANERMRAAYAQEPGWWFRDIASDPKYRQLVGGAS